MYEVDYQLYNDLQQVTSSESLFKRKELISSQETGDVYDVILDAPFRGNFIYKVIPENSLEEKILKKISRDILDGKAPKMFSFLYKTINEYHTAGLLLMKADTTVKNYVQNQTLTESFWLTFLHKISTAIEYLESINVNHNDLTFDNIMFYQNTEVMIIDFGSSVMGLDSHSGLPTFIRGRDLNYFFYLMVYLLSDRLPRKLTESIYKFIHWENIGSFCIDNDTEFSWNLKRSNIITPNDYTTGIYFKAFIENNYIIKTKINNYSKILQMILGGIAGDLFSISNHLDFTTMQTIKVPVNTQTRNGVYKYNQLPPGTISDNMHFTLLMLQHYATQSKFIPSVFSNTLLLFEKSYEKIIRTDMKKYLETFQYSPFKKKYNSDSLTRFIAIPIKYFNEPIHTTIYETQNVVGLFENTDNIIPTIIINCIIYRLLNNDTLKSAVLESLRVVKDSALADCTEYIPLHLFHTITYTRLHESKTLYSIIQNALWCVYNTNSTTEAIEKASNIKGMTIPTATLSGLLSCLLRDDLPKYSVLFDEATINRVNINTVRTIIEKLLI